MNVLIPPSPKYPQGQKCGNSANLSTTWGFWNFHKWGITQNEEVIFEMGGLTPSTKYGRSHDFSVTNPRCYKDFYGNNFFLCTARLWNSLPIKCFPLTYDLNDFKFRINKYIVD